MSERISAAVAAAAAPQTSNNRTCDELVGEIAGYIGGETSIPARLKAKNALMSAIRNHNTWAWVFNRQVQTITFVNDTSEYPLDASTRNSLFATLLDTNGNEVMGLEWIDYKGFLLSFDARIGTSQIPTHYTFPNVHRLGEVKFHPRIGTGGFSYPTCRIDWHSRIDFPASSQVINVPEEVEQSIFELAVAYAIEKVRSFIEGARSRAIARDLRIDLEAEYRDYPDFRRSL